MYKVCWILEVTRFPHHVLVPIPNEDGIFGYVILSAICFVAIYLAIKSILQFNFSNRLICLLLLSWCIYTCIDRELNDDLNYNSDIIETMSTCLLKLLIYSTFIPNLLSAANPSQAVFILYSLCGMSTDSIKLVIPNWPPSSAL